jgi:hypothetical protein
MVNSVLRVEKEKEGFVKETDGFNIVP